MSSINYKGKLLEFLSSWHQYRVLQSELEVARTNGNVSLVTDLLKRINYVRQSIDDDVAPILNTIRLEEKASKTETPIIPLKRTRK